MDPLERPIGYWAKLLHDRLEAHFAADLGEEGLLRRHWQVLNSLARRQHDRAELSELLAPFWTEATEPGLDAVLADLNGRGWLSETDEGLRLSDAGLAVRERIRQRVEVTRRRLLVGLGPSGYADTVTNLARMADNLAPT